MRWAAELAVRVAPDGPPEPGWHWARWRNRPSTGDRGPEVVRLLPSGRVRRTGTANEYFADDFEWLAAVPDSGDREDAARG
jgi:hypothetical protein